MRGIAKFLLLGCAALVANAGQRSVKEQLDVALSAVDRIEIYSVADAVDENRKPIERRPIGVVEGGGVGRAFCGIWSADDRSSDWQCMCDGDLYLDFFSGTRKLQRLRYFHGIAFRLETGALTGSAGIRKEDRAKVLEWLNRHGAASLNLRVEEEPNQAPEPTTTLVTPRADARVAPSAVVAHL